MTATERFHEHLDICEKCRTKPMALCSVGASLLQRAATDGLPLPSEEQRAEIVALLTEAEQQEMDFATEWARLLTENPDDAELIRDENSARKRASLFALASLIVGLLQPASLLANANCPEDKRAAAARAMLAEWIQFGTPSITPP